MAPQRNNGIDKTGPWQKREVTLHRLRGLLAHSIRLTNEAIIDRQRSRWLAQQRPLSGSSSSPRSRCKCQGHRVRRSTQFYPSPICKRLITGPPHGRGRRRPPRGEDLIFPQSLERSQMNLCHISSSRCREVGGGEMGRNARGDAGHFRPVDQPFFPSYNLSRRVTAAIGCHTESC